MAAPFTVVTFYDADDYPFPIRVEGTNIKEQRPAMILQASRLLDRHEANGDMRPRHPLGEKVDVEVWGGKT